MSKEATMLAFERQEELVEFYWLNGCYRHLDGKWINGGKIEDWQDLLTLCYGEDGTLPFQLTEKRVAPELLPNKMFTAVSEGVYVWVIRCGELL